MKKDDSFPTTLVEATRYFANPDTALAFVVSIRWPHGVTCPRCGSKDVSFISTRRIWKCGDCQEKKQFSAKVGTIMEDSPIPLDKWLVAIWLIVSAKNGISSYELHRALGVTQKSAWFLGHRVRLALQNGTFEKLSGEVEADETLLGGLARKMNTKQRGKRLPGTGGTGKTIVMGLLERKGNVVAKVIPNARKKTVQAEVHKHVEVGSAVYTDALRSYNGLNSHFAHEAIDHAVCYAAEQVHTNGLENFWCLLKRSIKGTYVSVEPFHLARYVNEQVFRYNARKGTDAERFLKAVPSIIGRRLTYASLTRSFSGDLND
jgi:transposase-like protein